MDPLGLAAKPVSLRNHRKQQTNLRYPELIPASGAILSSTTFKDDFDAGLTKMGSNKLIFEQEVLFTEADFFIEKWVLRRCRRLRYTYVFTA